jgi:SAM-dependent methyltransferase
MTETKAKAASKSRNGEAHYCLGDYILGIEGLAILREAQRRQFDRLEARRGEVQGVLEGYEEEPLSTPRDLPDADLDEGYTTWSETYDHPTERDPDPIQALEGPVMRAFIDGLPDGPVLDLACGTGRHTAYIAEAGHEVLGIDSNAAMLEHAKRKLPDVEFLQGELAKLPIDDSSYQWITCGLAVGHLPELDPAVSELARVLSPGGQVAISAPHPFITGILGWRAPVFDAEGNGWQVPEYPHPVGSYVEAFGNAGLTPRECHEPVLTEEHAVWNPEAEPGEENPFAPALIDALAGQPGAIVWVAEKA